MVLKKKITILIAEDDEDDKYLILKAFARTLPQNNVICVEDGEVLIQYLNRVTPYDEDEKYPVSDIILLDLNMPRKDGKAALAEIKSHDVLKKIPVIIFTTSTSKEDIDASYSLGSNSFITKPNTFEGLLKITEEIKNYWANTVVLPS
jgi:CheY-like chemotaxis protein